MTIPRSPRFFFAGFIALFSAIALPVDLRAQGNSATAQVRLWKTELRDLTGVRVSLKSAGGRHATPHDIGGGGPGYVFDSYADAPAGRGLLEVFAGTNDHPLVSLPTNFDRGNFYTVLLRESEKAGGPPRLEIIADSAAGADPTSAQITVRNFVENLKDVRVTVGDSVSAQFPSGEGFMQMHGIKPAVYPINTVGNGPDGKPFSWSTETDLKQHHHQTLLIYPDPYGRIRPRVCVDGESTAGPADEKRSQH